MSKKLDDIALNRHESNFGGDMSAKEVADMFGENAPKEVKAAPLPQTEEELEEYEKKLNNSTDIYKIAARIKNEARKNGGLTSHGEMLCNTFVHVLKALYDFADTMKDPEEKEKLIKIIRLQEKVPGNFIGAALAGVKSGKEKK